MSAATELDDLAASTGTDLSVWAGPVAGPPWLTRRPDTVHPAASTLKLPLVIAAHRLAATGRLNLDDPVLVKSAFASAADGRPYELTVNYDNDDVVWRRLGEAVSIRWLMERAVVRSSNLATNLLLEQVGTVAVNDVYDAVGAERSRLRRGIQDTRASALGITNTGTAADLAAVVCGLLSGRLLDPAAADAVERLLAASEWNDAIPAGLPVGTYVAHKSGWTDECCHDVGVVRPAGDDPFVLSLFSSTSLAEEAANAVVAEAADICWRQRPRRRRLDA
ncbi:MAG TPA: serine hydrolase [Nocardioidaceae bacterium]|nr:serine hydrolase [Nocardioidaceae bacterium]